MNKLLDGIDSIFASIGSNTACLLIIAFLALCLKWLYTDNQKLTHELNLANANVTTMRKTIEKQNADIEKYKADTRKYNEAVVSEVKTIKSRTAVETENVKMELKKDNSDTNQLKLLDKKLMDFSNGK